MGVVQAFRSALPGDARFLAWAMLAASRSHLPRGMWDLLLDTSAVERIEILTDFARTALPHAAHFSHFRVAEVRGEPAAALSAFSADAVCAEQYVDALLEVLEARGWTEARMEAMLQRSSMWSSIDAPETPGAWIIEWVAAVPAHRHAGLVQQLLDDALRRGAELGHRLAELRVGIGNTPAIAAYEKRGFRITSLHLSPELHAALGLSGIVRMQRPLEPCSSVRGLIARRTARAPVRC